MRRRTFLRTAVGAGAAICTRPGWAADTEIEIVAQNPGATISPHIYGHFIEHLGGVIYDGIWVGTDSKIPNVGGIRKSFVDDMKRISAPDLRWPGGCFADGYHWRDGIGPSAQRPRTYNDWQPQMPAGTDATETNHFGLHEFIRLCRLVGAEPYLAANVGSGTPKEFHDWVSYCNAPAGTLTLAAERAANGDTVPFNVRYWGVGNESWGCGGRMTPTEYAGWYRQFTSQVPEYTRPFLIACGPRGHSADLDMGWTTGFFEALIGVRGAPPDGFAMHYYTDFRPTPVKGESSNAREWNAVVNLGQKVEHIIEQHWAAMGRYDKEHRTKLVIDEWGTWYSQGRRIAPGYILSQTITLRDAFHAALTLDIYNRHADKIAMTNIAQTINCLHSLFAAYEDQYVRTPVFHVFDLYRGHMGGRLLPLRIVSEVHTVPLLQGSAEMASVAGSASLHEGVVTLTLTNASTDAPATARVRASGGAHILEARGALLTHAALDAANTFERPDLVKPSPVTPSTSAGVVSLVLPAKSVAALQMRLA
jgi:alpha-N-arabinofuranosidase